MRYIKKFETSEAVQTALNNQELGNPYVALVGNDIDWNSLEPEPDYSTIPLTFKITGDGYINWKASNSANTKTIEYSKNDGDWTSITSTTEGVQIPVVSGDTVKFRGNNNSYTHNNEYNTFSGTTSNFKVKGNIMSLIDSTDYVNMTSFPVYSSYNFYLFFWNCTTLTDASELVLPATTSVFGCYYNMFKGCTSLTTAPALPATTLDNYCYQSMFDSCSSLTTAPELPATTLTNYCYYQMFQGCTSLTQAPVLPATTLADHCYSNMFQGCISLTTAPELPATTLATYCYSNMFQYCTSLTTAPELPATTLANYCYNSMFRNCSSLNYIKCLATDISAISCTSNWVRSVQTTSGTFITPSTTQWSTGYDGIPSNWTRVDSE